MWRRAGSVGEGTTRSLDFGCADKVPTVLVIPSPIHRTISPISCPSAAFCSILRVSVSGCSSAIGKPAVAKGAISPWPTTSPDRSKPLSRERGGSRTADWGYRSLHGGSSRSRYVASVKPPVLRCSRLLGISMPSWADPAPGIRRRSARSPLRTCRQRASRDDSNSILCPRSLYGGTQIPPGRDPPARAPDRLGASVATWLRTRLG